MGTTFWVMLLLEKCYCVLEWADIIFLHCKKLLEHFIVNVRNLDIKVKNTKKRVNLCENITVYHKIDDHLHSKVSRHDR